MNTPTERHTLTVIKQALEACSQQHPDLHEIPQRFLGMRIDRAQQLWVLDLFSQGLSLQRKAQWEEVLYADPALQQLAQKSAMTVRVNFTRQGSSAASITKPPLHSQVHSQSSQNSQVAAPATPALPQIGALYAIASGKGGVGKSSVAAYLATLLHQQGARVGLLDADIHGPSSHLLMNLSGDLQVSPQGKLIPHQRDGLKCMSFGFLSDDQHPVVWRGPMISKALQQFLFEVEWGPLDHLILDLPPGTGDIPMTLAESVTLDGVLITTTLHPIALIDAQKAIAMFHNLHVPLLGIIANMTSYSCPHCHKSSQPFGDMQALTDISHRYHIPVLAQLPFVSPQEADLSSQVVPPQIAKALQKVTHKLQNPT